MKQTGYLHECEDCRAKLDFEDILRADDLCAECFDLRLHKSELKKKVGLGPVPGMTPEAAAMYDKGDGDG